MVSSGTFGIVIALVKVKLARAHESMYRPGPHDDALVNFEDGTQGWVFPEYLVQVGTL
jgi:hypothetical protein